MSLFEIKLILSYEALKIKLKRKLSLAIRLHSYYFEIVSDLVQERLDMAKRLGADATMLIKKDVSEKDNIKTIYELFDGQPDKTIDASGAQSSIRLAILVNKTISNFP